MKTKRPLLFQSLASAVDQVLLSGLNFLIGIALTRYASKETYGLYSQLFAAGLLTTVLLGALIGTALTTLSVRLPPAERLILVARAARIQWAASAVLAVISGVGVSVLAAELNFAENRVYLGLSFAAFVFALGSRENCRSALFIHLQSENVAKLDFIFVFVTLIGAAYLWLMGHITVASILCVLAISNGIAAIFYSFSLVRSAGPSRGWRSYLTDFESLWSLSRWTLSGAILGWFISNSYLYIAGGFLGIEALADLNAARLPMIPIVIVATAWSNVAFPAFGGMIASSNWDRLRRFVITSFLLLEGFVLVYIVIVQALWPWISLEVLGEKYRHVSDLLVLWGCYFAANTGRNVLTMLLCSYGAYRDLFWQDVIAIPVLLISCGVLMPWFGVKGALTGMIALELWRLVIYSIYLLPRAKKNQLGSS